LGNSNYLSNQQKPSADSKATKKKEVLEEILLFQARFFVFSQLLL
jgi:hypothetical protein